MTERRGMVLVVAVVTVLVIAGFGGGFTLARMSDTETKQVSVSAGTWTTTPGETPEPPEHAISFAAFCTADGTDAPASAVAITNVVRDDEGEPFGITYESDVELSTVVLKGGQTVENFSGGASDTVHFGNGTTAADSQTSPEPCPNGEPLLVEFEYVDDTDSFDSATETQDTGTTGNSENRSPTNTPSATSETNDSTEASPSTSSETTAEPASTAAETTTTTETSTATASQTSAETGTAASPTATTDQRTAQTNGNQTTGATTDG